MLEIRVPVKAVSEANQREHWAPKAKRQKSHKSAAYLRVLARRPSIKPVLKITLTRVSPRALDGDNLQGSMKAVRDGVCKALRIDDASPLVRFEYAQAKGEPGVIVRVEPWDA